ncbi:WD repeat-containing protein 47-like protein [Dinothrombium tinctorium]|uniref:WD repeat-containing protein 47-like protein n=1 Tax=Dinothrombium tinctorium TaxID=1965070 RepID=A0A3S4QK86_9ACAR|nr:WD repeat-containing protein 47-like protein [Dinothrombium tinctorium]RWS07067.1 WD repeat-containing protein 47-like protein [Dinothrombium tinctorium]
MILEFLSNRALNISQMCVERETGVYNGLYSDDLLFLRQLILDGQWDDVLEFIQPLTTCNGFDKKAIYYLIYKHKYLELLCIRSEASPFQNMEVAVAEVVKCLNKLDEYCPSKEDYNELCFLLTLPSLDQHKDYKNWNPSSSRINCFNQMLPLIEKYLPYDQNANEIKRTSSGDRLLQLIIKGILYESCVEYCQQRATANSMKESELNFTSLLEGTGFSSADLSLLSWLQSIPPETFSYPFEQKILNVDIEQIEKPSLVASWSEVILATPIKPRVFPHSATPFTRMKASDLMSKSLTPGLIDKLSQSIIDFSIGDVAAMSRSSMTASGFHLSSVTPLKKSMQTSVDKLFEEGDVFNSSCIGTLPTITEKSTPTSVKSPDTPKFTDTLASKSTFVSAVSKEKSESNKSAKIEDLNSPDLWRAFQEKKRVLLEKLREEELLLERTFSPSNSNNQKFFNSIDEQSSQSAHLKDNQIITTPENQVGQRNFPGLDLLTASTPKGNRLKPQESLTGMTKPSPIYPLNDQNISLKSNANRNVTQMASNMSVRKCSQFSL